MATHGSLAATRYTQNPQNAVKYCSSITTESKSMKCVHSKGGSSETHKQLHCFPVLLSSDILFFLMSHQGNHGRWRSPKRGIQNAISALLHCAAESLLLKSITAQKQTNNKPSGQRNAFLLTSLRKRGPLTSPTRSRGKS